MQVQQRTGDGAPDGNFEVYNLHVGGHPSYVVGDVPVHNCFGTSIISTILSESGKFGLQLTLAHQFISQLEPEIRDAVLGNCSTIISFRVGAEDAPTTAKALDWDAQDLQDLPLGRARMRTLYKGGPTSALLMETEKVELPTGHLAANIRHTRASASRPRRLVDEMMRPKQSRRTSSW